ncbi:MAG: hypothetical protein E3J87_06930 [Candidatus Cloacimonadota bacterium]|nr:MAG: hypothetical protein E3J87_06930 [Candidatus Cloacimonadota bacterium]
MNRKTFILTLYLTVALVTMLFAVNEKDNEKYLGGPMLRSPVGLLFTQDIVVVESDRDDLLFDQTATGYHMLYNCSWDSVNSF